MVQKRASTMRQSTKNANADHLVTAIPDHLAHANLDLHFRDQRLKGRVSIRL
jgi:hypothetical protein